MTLTDQSLELSILLHVLAGLRHILILYKRVFDLGLPHRLQRPRDLDPIDLLAFLLLLFRRLSIGWPLASLLGDRTLLRRVESLPKPV